MDDSFQLQSLPLDEQLPFAARIVYVDNYTDRWIYLPNANRFCPPYRAGLSFRLLGVRRARALFQKPGSLADAPSLSSQIATLTFSDEG